MVLGGIIAGVGAALAGFGVLKAGRAADRVGRGAESTLDTISREVTHLRVFLTDTAWPEVNKTIVDVRKVLDRADVFLVTSTFTTKVLGLLLALCAAYVTHKLTSARFAVSRWQRKKTNKMAETIEDTILQIMYCLCLTLAFVLVLQLVGDLFNMTWPHSIPIVFLVPSLTTMAVLYHHLTVVVMSIVTLLKFIPYVTIEYPISKARDPITRVSGYMNAVLPLRLGICVIYLVLYSAISYVAYLLIVYLLQSEKSNLRCLLIVYGVFYAASLVICDLSALVISIAIRPFWAYRVRGHY